MKLANKNAIVTGASQGLGKEIARHYLRAGASVAIGARDGAMLRETARELETEAQPGRRVFAQTCDVSSEQAVAEFCAIASEELGDIHILVANAGIYGPMGPTEAVPFDEWARAVSINLYGVLLPCRAIIPRFKERGSGKIVVISGGGATNPMPNISAYAASKAAVVRLVECLALELEPFGVQVNAIAPGALKTRMMEEVLAAGPEKVGPKFFAQNEKWAEEGATSLDLGASLAVHLGSEESGRVTGRLLSARWDPWQSLAERESELAASDIYCLRRIVPEDRGKKWD
jgi:NAD(P)-dependent dehydrogenase (short-subunit alcohol dehydrogenase family)